MIQELLRRCWCLYPKDLSPRYLLEESRNLSEITLTKLVNAIQATEKRRQTRKEESLKNDLFMKQKNKTQGHQNGSRLGEHNNNNARHQQTNRSYQSQPQAKKIFPPCPCCKKLEHAPFKCWWKSDAFFLFFQKNASKKVMWIKFVSKRTVKHNKKIL